jgi:hypothetical protein
VFGEFTQQEDVYETAARELVVDFLNGVSASLFAYGQTGSGKTHTFFGPDLEASVRVTPRSGVVPRACSEAITAVLERQALGHRCSLNMSFVEVYGDDINDLLKSGAAVGPWHGVGARSVLRGLAQVPVTSLDEAEHLLRKGEKAKRTAATAMNARSTRAHSLIILALNQQHIGETGPMRVVSHLILADLGGSEDIKLSGVEGDRRAEAVMINLGLLSLKNCISALLDKQQFVPYTSSSLTSILQPALGGGCKTRVIVTCSQDPRHTGVTYDTLRFGEQCRQLTGKGNKLSVSPAIAAIAALNTQIQELEQMIQKEERWQTVERRRMDEEGEERILVTVPVGAEHLRERYEALIARRRDLLCE